MGKDSLLGNLGNSETMEKSRAYTGVHYPIFSYENSLCKRMKFNLGNSAIFRFYVRTTRDGKNF